MIDVKYKKIYDEFVDHYKNIHINPWHEISEDELEKIYHSLINSMDINNDYNFKYFMDYIIKRLSGTSDAHTKYDSVSFIPMNFRMFNNDILVNFPQCLKNSKLVSINGVEISTIILELEDVVTYGTLGKRKYELEKALFNKCILFGLPSLRNCNELVFEIESIDGQKITKTFDKTTQYSKEELFDYDQYRYGQNATYQFFDHCLIYTHSSVQMKFKDDMERAIYQLRNEDLTDIDTIIIDIRGNTGGNSSLNSILMNFLSEHRDKKLICLTDYRVFSGGRFALRDLIHLGAITLGEEIGTPINCYGNSNWVNIDGYWFSISECYFHPFIGWSASSKEEFQKEATPELLSSSIFHPDILIEETEEDYIQGIDTVLNYALEYSRTMIKKENETRIEFKR